MDKAFSPRRNTGYVYALSMHPTPVVLTGRLLRASNGTHSGDDKDSVIRELRETVQILQLKVQKLENLVQIKDTQLDTLTKKPGK